MALVTIYLPESVEKAVRQEATRARKSVSAYIADLARAQVAQARLPDHFADLYGSWHGRFPDVVDRPPEPVELMIAATALAWDLTVATLDHDDFRRVPGLRVAAW